MRLEERGSDEMADMAVYFNQVMQKIQHSVQEVDASTDTMSAIGERLASNMTQTASAGISSAMHEQRQEVESTLKTIQDLNAITAEIKSGSGQMLENGQEMAREMRNLNQLTQEISNGMTEMSMGTSHINEAILEVRDITIENKDAIDRLAAEVKKFKVR